MKKTNEKIIGIDEVGRGSLAGPVVVAAVAVSRDCDFKKQFSRANPRLNHCLDGRQARQWALIKDSKKLTKIQREKRFNYLTKDKNIYWAIVSVGTKTIDKINISNAANLAAEKSFKKLIRKRKIVNAEVFLDGGLYLKNILNPKFHIQNSIVKGDEKIPAVAAASIIAKVYRDKLMDKFHKKYPQYGFNLHKGYGTKTHLEKLKKCGASVEHRFSYEPVFQKLSFKDKIYYLVSKIPKGEMKTCKEIAVLAGKPKAWRAVGNMLNKNYDKKISCHRVIKFDGRFGGYNRGAVKNKKFYKKIKYAAAN